MVDANGKVTYSKIISLLNYSKGFDIIYVIPNPVTNGGLKLNLYSGQPSDMDIQIIDMQGRVVHRQSAPVNAGYNSIDMNVSTLAAGVYAISAGIGEEQSGVVRFVKEL
jgi:hypothetical protein